MSKIGKAPIAVPDKVKISFAGRRVSIEGTKGKLAMDLPEHTTAALAEGKLIVTRDGDNARSRAMHGLCRALLNNMVRGVHTGFEKRLEIQGVGFKAAVQGKIVNMQLGQSHEINHAIPEQVKVTVDQNTKILIEGPDRQVVGQLAAELRGYYPPEPYTGTGVRYVGETVERKKGKREQ